MPRALKISLSAWIAAVFVSQLLLGLAFAQTVWTGFDVHFVKAAFSDPTLPENQDRITDSISLTRGSSQGIYNIAMEEFYTNSLSPAGTAWAFPNNNPSAVLAATNWQELVFQKWEAANGGAGGGPPSTVGQNAVVHLIADDIYLDIRFTSWSSGSTGGGEFSYDRAIEPSSPAPTGDYNANGTVDAADYVAWRNTFGQTAAPNGSGADGNASGTIDDGDYDFWKARFGNAVPSAAATLFSANIPEPMSILLALVAWSFVSRSFGISCMRHPTTRI